MKADRYVPKQLAQGTKVVVWIKPDYYLFGWELAEGIKHCAWIKGTIVNKFDDNDIAVKFNDNKFLVLPFRANEAIIIRSTSEEDNPNAWAQNYGLRKLAAQQDKMLRRESIGTYKGTVEK